MGEEDTVPGHVLDSLLRVVVRGAEVLDQNAPSFELLRTLRTLAEHVGRVYSHVVIKSTGLIKSLPTFFADIVLFICVNSLMPVKVANVAK